MLNKDRGRQEASYSPEAELDRLIPEHACVLIRDRALGLHGAAAATDSEVVQAFLVEIFNRLPESYTPRALRNAIISTAEDPTVIGKLPPHVKPGLPAFLAKIAETVGPAMREADIINAWGDVEGRAIMATVNNARYREADKYHELGQHFTDAFHYFTPPEIAATIISSIEPVQYSELLTTMDAAQNLSRAVYRGLTEVMQLPSSGGSVLNNFELSAKVDPNGLRTSSDSPLLLRVQYSYGTLDIVTVITPLGEMKCFKGADGISQEDSARALALISAELGYELCTLSEENKRSCLGLERYCDSPILLAPSRASGNVVLPRIPFGRVLSTSDFLGAIPLERTDGISSGLGTLKDREKVVALREAVAQVLGQNMPCSSPGIETGESVELARKLYRDEQISCEQLIGAIFEGPQLSRTAAVLALAARGEEAVYAVLNFDKVEYVTEDLADLYSVLGIELEENCIVAPDLIPTIYSKEVLTVFSCLSQNGVRSFVNVVCGFDDTGKQVNSNLQRRAHDLLKCENPYLIPELCSRLEEPALMHERAAAVVALERLEVVRGLEQDVVVTMLADLTAWTPADDSHKALRLSAMADCVSLMASIESPTQRLGWSVADAFCELVEQGESTPSSIPFTARVTEIVRRLSWQAEGPLGRIQEFLNNDCDPGTRDSWRKLTSHWYRIVASSPEGWTAYSESRKPRDQ